jgi:predicted RNase H-like HicB family nuclease
MGYTVILEREAEGGYVAMVPALPSRISQGDPRDAALRHIREAIELYSEDYRDAGDPVPQEADREAATDLVRALHAFVAQRVQ